MSTKISKQRFIELLKNIIRNEIEEILSSGGGTGTGIYYDTPKAFLYWFRSSNRW